MLSGEKSANRRRVRRKKRVAKHALGGDFDVESPVHDAGAGEQLDDDSVRGRKKPAPASPLVALSLEARNLVRRSARRASTNSGTWVPVILTLALMLAVALAFLGTLSWSFTFRDVLAGSEGAHGAPRDATGRGGSGGPGGPGGPGTGGAAPAAAAAKGHGSGDGAALAGGAGAGAANVDAAWSTWRRALSVGRVERPLRRASKDPLEKAQLKSFAQSLWSSGDADAMDVQRYAALRGLGACPGPEELLSEVAGGADGAARLPVLWRGAMQSAMAALEVRSRHWSSMPASKRTPSEREEALGVALAWLEEHVPRGIASAAPLFRGRRAATSALDYLRAHGVSDRSAEEIAPALLGAGVGDAADLRALPGAPLQGLLGGLRGEAAAELRAAVEGLGAEDRTLRLAGAGPQDSNGEARQSLNAGARQDPEGGEGPFSFTIVTQTSIDRAALLADMCDAWEGPIAAAVFVGAATLFPAAEQQRHGDFYDAAALRTRCAASALSLAFVTSDGAAFPTLRQALSHNLGPGGLPGARSETPSGWLESLDAYPINALRNAALRLVGAMPRGAGLPAAAPGGTTHVLLIDVDQVPSRGMHAALSGALEGLSTDAAAEELRRSGAAVLADPWSAIVVPAFETSMACELDKGRKVTTEGRVAPSAAAPPGQRPHAAPDGAAEAPPRRLSAAGAPGEAARPSCAETGKKCAGSRRFGPSLGCCEGGARCFRKHDSYGQCRLSCPGAPKAGEAPWLCRAEGAFSPHLLGSPLEEARVAAGAAAAARREEEDAALWDGDARRCIAGLRGLRTSQAGDADLLRQCLGSGHCRAFHSLRFPAGHGSTNASAWAAQERSTLRRLPCFGSERYEPYLVLPFQTAEGARAGVPPGHERFAFDETFSGYGLNKIQFTQALRLAGFAFYVLPEHFLFHSPHRSSTARRAFEGGATPHEVGDACRRSARRARAMAVEYTRRLVRGLAALKEENGVPERTLLCAGADLIGWAHGPLR